MNAPERLPLPDVQAGLDARNLPIDRVGIKRIRYPFVARSGGHAVHTIGTWSIGVALPPHVKGTHMSRFVELLESQREPLDIDALGELAARMLERLDATSGSIEVSFPYFVAKAAPVSGITSLLDYEVTWRVSVDRAAASARIKVVVPATSLCPCSRDISEYGAHNQRSHITIDAGVRGAISIEELASIAERSASCEVYGLLKRADEKYVTERAYDNAKFAEDLVRDVALELDREPRVTHYVVEAENFESIHNHSAFARIERVVGRSASDR
jgi:GTP cyclohydrolase IB